MKSSKHLLTSIIILFVIIFFQFATPQSAQAACAPNHIIYVRPTGTNVDGCSWATAFTTLQSALAIATSGDQIWVASGTYYPDEGTGQTNNDQASTFVLIDGVSLYGGFAGTPGTEALFVRNSNPATNNTTLSGDIDQDGMDADNAFIVVTVTGILTDTFILDGFTITNGYEDSGSGQGGGIYIEETSPTLANLIVTNNFATSNGGGIYTITVGFNPADETTYNRPALTNVTISNNTAARGGGVYTRNSSPILTNVTISSNTATGGAGGGMNNQTNSTADTPSIPRLSNVTFSNNTANGGGALFNGDSNAILTNITFSGNTANIRGGAVLNEGSNPVFRNVTFSGNTAPAGTGGAMRNVIGGAPANKNSNPFLYNSILWGDTAGGGNDEITSDGAGATTITDSVVENGCQPIGSTCTNIITTNPNLGALLPNAPGLTQTRAISIGSSALDTGGVNVACAATDQRGIIRPQGAACDIGAFEYEGNSTTTTAGNASATYGAISVNLTATVSSNPGGGTVQFYIDGNPVGAPVSVNAGDGTATFSYNPSALNAGTYTIRADFSGFGSFLSSSSNPANNGTLTINQRAATVTPNAASKVYGDLDPAPLTTGTLIGFLPADNVTATYSRTTGETVAGGPYTINATLSPAGVLGNYNITYNTANFTITQRPASVTPNAASKVYGNLDPAPLTTGTLTGFLPADNVTATYSRTAGETVAGSPYTISATLNPAGVLGNYMITYNTANFTITQRPASVTPNAASKVYGDLDPAPLTTGTLTGFLPADNVTATYSRTAGETVAGSPYTISATLNPAGVLGNYNITYNTANFTITQRPASVTPNAASKVYGDLDPAPLTTGTLTGFIPADNVTATYARTAGETVAGSPYTISATLNPAGVLGNYNITYNTANFTITQRPASVTPNAASKVYGDLDPAPLTTGTLTGFLPADNVTATYSRTAGETVAGSPYTISATLNPAGVLGNYNITYNTANFTITGIIVTPSITANNKVYDDNNTATFTCTLTGVVGTDDVNCSGGTATFINQNVGTNKLVTAIGLTLSGADIASYTLAPTTTTDTADITARTLNVTATGTNKPYDGNTTATVTLADDRLVGDVLTLTYTSAAFLDPNVGVGKTVNVSGISISGGADAGNYVLASTAAATSAEIAAIAASVTPNNANKVYGNLDPAPLTTGILIGFLPADNVTATYSRTAGETVAGSPYTISATLSPAGVLGNYNITYNTANFTITQRPASVTPNAASKAYGAADPAPLTTGTLTGFLPADNVTATYSRTAGETVAGSPYTISATLSPAGVLGNYNITYNTANFTITGIIVTPSITANNKVYDDNNTATFTCTLTGVVGTDDVNCSGGTATFINQNVGTNKLVTAIGLTLSGADIASYTLAPTTATDTADITARTLNVTATGINKPYDGNTTATVALADDRLVGDVLTLTYTSATFLDPNVGVGKTINVSGISISAGADAGNYVLASTAAATTADIAAIAASVTPNNAGKVFGAADPIPLTTGTLSGFLAGDGVTATYTRAVGEAVGPYTISATLNPAGVLGNYNITYNTATFTIGQTTPTITWSNPANITYGTALGGTQLNATASVPGTFTYTPSAGTILNAGNGQNLHVDFVPTDTATYTNASADVAINVNKAVLTVLADNQSINFGDPDPAFTFTYSTFVPGDTSADIDTPPTCTVSGPHANVGTYPIVCSGGIDNNYSFSYVNGTLSVGLVSQTITINTPAPGTLLFPGNSFTVAATASSGLPVVYSASGACTNSGATFTMTAGTPGVCTVVYDQPGNANYGPAPQLTETVGIALVVITNGINSNTDTGDGRLAEFEAASVAITQLTVNFNKNVDNPAGNTLTDDVTNPDNYILVADNGDGIQTSACNVGVTGGDLVIPVNTAAYNNNGGSGPFVTTIGVNGGSALPIGTYRLIVCGTTSIVDLTGTPLAGNGLASGTDFIRNFSVTNIASTSTAKVIPDTGFPKNAITALPIQPADKAYASTDLWIEIPKLGVKMSIVGVPQTKAGWDVTWLDKNAGWLNGSAFPTWQGNSVITAHVWDALNKPGPFAGLKELKYGDQIKIHAFGQVFTYELRESTVIAPTNTAAMLKHEEKSWLTLITCEDYKELTQKYPYRRMVRAVLVSVTAEK